MNFAMHIRMGDRAMYIGNNSSDYFGYLEAFIDTVTRVVHEDMGKQVPLFHIFSETKEPCPNSITGAFEEFPQWPVERHQVKPCTSVASFECCQ